MINQLAAASARCLRQYAGQVTQAGSSTHGGASATDHLPAQRGLERLVQCIARICIQALKQDDFASFRDFYFGLLDNKIHTRIEHVSEIKGQI
jgi:hypothetical protein